MSYYSLFNINNPDWCNDYPLKEVLMTQMPYFQHKINVHGVLCMGGFHFDVSRKLKNIFFIFQYIMDIKLLEKLVFPVYVLSVWPIKFFHSNNCTVHTDKTHTGRRYTKRMQTIRYQNNANWKWIGMLQCCRWAIYVDCKNGINVKLE